MLSIEGRPFNEIDGSKDLIKFPGAVFDAFYGDDWLDDPFSRKVITDIQKVDVMDTSRHTEEILRQRGLAPRQLANGTKNLLVCKFYLLGRKCRLAMMGPNCYKWLMDIADEKDICGVTTDVIKFTDEDLKGRSVLFVDTGVSVTTSGEFIDEMLRVYEMGAMHYEAQI